MKRLLLFACIILLLSACQSTGSEGGKCLEGGTCAQTNLICNQQNICELCGKNHKPCCSGNACPNGLTCTEAGYCETCGGVGQPCCGGTECQTGLRCDSDHTCQYCGILGNPCCEGGKCDDLSVCDFQNMCQPCGMQGEPCCTSGNYLCYEGACVADQTCQTEICDAAGNCSECGILTQPCCEGDTCHVGYICGANNQCENCGWRGDSVCADGTCAGYLQNVNGTCLDPFKANPTANVSLCEKAEPGYRNITDRDWCYWYAAFYKKDATICSKIVWATMKEKCQQMANPDDYSVTSW